jgi:hypothetical protein
MPAIAGDALKQAQTSTQKHSQPLVANVSDAVTNLSDALSNQQNLLTSFDALMEKVDVLVKVGDEVAKVCFLVSSSLSHNLNRYNFKIHPYVNFAWQVLSVGLKVISIQSFQHFA